ncbi:MAG: hypothetical protein IJD71_06480 [Clostridia bacterium]|nr:hypothetical protein [Clostridia bacterium]MBQ4131966.1 hypothetical protein [Clostridia bacterium]
MKKNKREFKKRAFFRSFAITIIILFSVFTLIFGFLTGYTRMESQKTGKELNISEIFSFAVKNPN